MAQTSIAGTYFTSWAYDVSTQSFQLGPIVVISTDNSVTVDGVAIQGPMVMATGVSWTSAAGNPSSAMLLFQYSSQFNAMTFSGTYWTTADSPPSGTNIYGFATQPAEGLSAWNNTYNSYETTSNNGQESLGTLIISSPNVTFAGKTINNPIYTGLTSASNNTDVNELAWFTSDGNDNNVAISFFTSSQNTGVVLFNGDIWSSNESRPEGSPPSVNNFFGTTQEASDAAQNAQVDEYAQDAHVAEMAAVGFVMAAAMGYAGADNAQNAAQDAGQQADNNAQEAQQEAAPNNEGGVGENEGGGENEPGAQEGGEDALDEVADALGEVFEAVGFAVPPDDRSAPPTRGASSKASGLSARQLLTLKNRS